MRLVSSNLANYHATVQKLLWHRKTRVPGVSCGVVDVILRFAVLVEHRLVTDTDTDGQTDTGTWLVPRMHSIAR